jgi:trimethylamine--corrinoid protein Co-methyltransferase
MRKQYLNFLSEEEMQKIHNASLAVLEQTGMRIDHQQAREMLQEAGARVDHESKIVRFPPDLVEKSLNSCPRELISGGRDPENDIIIKAGAEDLHGRCNAGATHYEDLNSGKYRRATEEDIKEFSVLVDALPNIFSCGGICAEGLPVQTSDIHCVQLMLKNQRKHVTIQPFTPNHLKYIIEMALAIRGDKEHLRKHF